MKCPICGKDVELKNRQVGTDENGEPVFNEYAVCRDCKKQWNLDRQRAKKMAAKKAAAAADTGRKAAETGHGAAPEAPGSAAVKKAAPGKDEPVKKPVQKNTPAEESPDSKKKAARRKPVPADAEKESPAGSRTRKPDTDRSKVVPYKKSADAAGRTGKAEGSASPKKRPVKKRPEGASSSDHSEEKRYGNIPSEKVRTKREKAVREGYEDMLSTDPRHKALRKKSARAAEEEKESLKSASGRRRGEEKKARKAPEPEIDDYDSSYDDYDETAPRFRAMRIVMGVLSLIGFAFFIYRGFVDGLQGISSGSSSSGTTYIILALCFLVSAMLYFIMMRKNTVLAFLLPMLFYLGSAVAAFLLRNDDVILLASAAAGGVLAVVSLILAIASRSAGAEDDDYDDPFEDDYDD